VNNESKKISTPCIRLCKLEDGFCVGCGRSWLQISQWVNYSEKTRQEIMGGLFVKNIINEKPKSCS